MAKSASSLHILFLLMLLCFNTDGPVKLVKGQGQSKTWCVAKPSSSDEELNANIQYACEQVGDGCKVIQDKEACFYPSTLINHASVAMNLYYQAYQRNLWNCDFKGSGLITLTNPSYGSCAYA